MEKIFESEKQLADFASDFAAGLKGGEILAMKGELGAGKTFFTKAMGKALGFSQTIISPTFNLVKIYQNDNQKFPIQILCHVDLYRLNSADEVLDLGVLDNFGQKNTCCVIEWADKFSQIIPKSAIWINFEVINNTKRKLSIRGLK